MEAKIEINISRWIPEAKGLRRFPGKGKGKRYKIGSVGFPLHCKINASKNIQSCPCDERIQFKRNSLIFQFYNVPLKEIELHDMHQIVISGQV